jgi:TonB family protein
MSSVVKDNEILASIPETGTTRPGATPTAAPATDASSRPQPVALEVPVTVNGARTVSGSDKREPFSESTKTVLIFAHGAVVRLSSSVAPGQLLFLTNEKTKKEVVCQVVKSKNYHNVSGYVELEFTESVAGFWGMRFPAATAPAQAPQVAASAVETTPKISGAVPHDPKLQTGSKPAIEANSSANDSAGRSNVKSNVSTSSNVPPRSANPAAAGQPAAPIQKSSPLSSVSTTHDEPSTLRNTATSDKPSKVVEISKSRTSATEAHAPTPKSTELAKSMLDSDEVKIPSWLEPLARNAAAASAALPELTPAEPLDDFGDAVEVDDLAVTEVADTPKVSTPGVPASSYGTHFLAEEIDPLSAKDSSGSNKKMMYGAVAAGLLLLAGGTTWYVRQQPADNVAVNTSATPNAAPTSASATQTEPQSPASTATPTGTYTAVSAPTSTNAVEPNTSPSNKRTATVDAVPEALTPEPKKSSLGAVNLSAPIVKERAVGQEHTEEALSLEASSQVGPGEGLASGLVSNSRQPAAPPAPLVAGTIKPARLVATSAAIYPKLARSQRVSGDVTIDALIDTTGHVSNMKIVSGPPLLQQSAMEALRQWKYEPAQLDGKAVAMHATVTVQFKLAN